ncbi:MAG: NUDIX domain-containing protein [Rhodobiaceae bacterium]|jgi:ADP-ribose pyrophosphatase YjhB (NUDIX family)
MTFQDKSRSYQKNPSFTQRTPHDDSITRGICDHCGLINYVNPKIVAGVVAVWEDKILMCRRAIEPRRGFWTLPAGFMEQQETIAEGAAREAFEEAQAKVEIDALIGIYNVARISQVQIFYRAQLVSPDIAAGPESEEVALLGWDEIPWKELAFPSVYWALQHYHQTREAAAFAPFSEPEDWTTTPGFEDLARRYSDG